MSCFRLTVDVHGIVTYQIIISSYPFLSCKFACSDNQGPKWVVSERFLTWYHSIRASPVGISSSPSVEHHTIIMIGKKSAILISCHDGILDSLGYGVMGSIASRTTGMGEEFSLGRPMGMGWDSMGWDGGRLVWIFNCPALWHDFRFVSAVSARARLSTSRTCTGVRFMLALSSNYGFHGFHQLQR